MNLIYECFVLVVVLIRVLCITTCNEILLSDIFTISFPQVVVNIQRESVSMQAHLLSLETKKEKTEQLLNESIQKVIIMSHNSNSI